MVNVVNYIRTGYLGRFNWQRLSARTLHQMGAMAAAAARRPDCGDAAAADDDMMMMMKW